MSVLGVVLRTRPAQLPAVLARLQAMPGVRIGPGGGDGRQVVLVEDAELDAASSMALMAGWSDVLNVSLVYEYSGPDLPTRAAPVDDYRAWRGSLHRSAA